MRKIQKVMIGIFCAGVFLTGLGSGLTVSEASSFTYMGQKKAGPVDIKTETFECTFEPKEDGRFMVRRYYGGQTSSDGLLPDAKLPENTIRFEVTYNSAVVRPYLEYEEDEYAVIRTRYVSDDFGIFMECKDQVLQELKDKKISSYRVLDIEEIKIFVNPSSMEEVGCFD